MFEEFIHLHANEY